MAKDRAEGKTGGAGDDDADVLLSEHALGQSAPSATGSVLGMEHDAASGESDIRLDSGQSDIKLADSQLKLGSGTGGSKVGKPEPKAGKPESKVGRSDSHVNLGDDLTLGSSVATMKGGSALRRELPARLRPGLLDLTAAGEGISEDELVLGGSSGVGSDVTWLTSDSGISLVDRP